MRKLPCWLPLTYQELMFKPDDTKLAQKSLKCEDSEFRVTNGQRLALLTATMEGETLDLGLINLETGQKTYFLDDLNAAEQFMTKQVNLWWTPGLIAAVVGGFWFKSWWVAGGVFFAYGLALYQFTDVLKAAERRDRVIKHIENRLPECLDSLYEQYRLQ